MRSFAVLALILACEMLESPSPIADAQAQSPPIEPSVPSNRESSKEVAAKADGADDNDVEDPELVALTWQYGPGELTPLVMVFRWPGPLKTGLSTALVLDGRRTQSGGTWAPFDANGLTKTACAPLQSALAKWPDSIVIDARVPLEDPQIIKTITAIPDGAVEVAPGVRWYIDPNRGIEFERGEQRRTGLKAAVFEVEDETFENLVTYQSAVWLRGKEQPLPGAYATIIQPRPGVLATIRVSKPLDDVTMIERVEFTRQRFKVQRFDEVKLRTDLLLPDDGDHVGDDEQQKKTKRRQKRD
ncbi:MAG TPA: hypothetical protein VFI31_28065 [Pirellulales bacterium]|nr:hypothetical protein [Pirellulales bacterium]